MRPKALDELFAAVCFFTRIPLYKFIPNIHPDSYRNVVAYWSIVGILTGGSMALGMYLGGILWGAVGGALMAVLFRLLLTGALHEDGWADCCDAFGGSCSREKALAIMKDSHIGTYGVLGLIVHFSLLSLMLVLLQIYASGWVLCLLIIWLDVSSKALVSLLHDFLPYAREEQEAKVGFSFKSLSIQGICYEFTPALLLFIGLLLLRPSLWWALLGALGIGGITFFAALRYLKHRIGGYTGDCYGGIFLLVELISYLFLIALLPHTL